MIYLDNASTMPPQAPHEIAPTRFNPSSTYAGGLLARRRVEDVRTTIATHLGVNKNDIYFTSGATEANNWILFGTTKPGRGNIVISGGEHASIFEPAMHLKQLGHDVRVAPLLPDGTVDRAELVKLIDEKTTLVSVIHVSNETGFINDLASISAVVKSKNPHATFHSDGVQAFLKVPTKLSSLGVDAYSISGHKIGAHTGIGALYAHKSVKLHPLLYGGSQENGKRAGTENTEGIQSVFDAAAWFTQSVSRADMHGMYTRLAEGIRSAACTTIVGAQSKNPLSGYILCVLFADVRAEILQTMLFERGIVVGRGSACSSKKPGNRVLEAAGYSRKSIEGAVRFSLSPFLTALDIEQALPVILETVRAIRERKIG